METFNLKHKSTFIKSTIFSILLITSDTLIPLFWDRITIIDTLYFDGEMYFVLCEWNVNA